MKSQLMKRIVLLVSAAALLLTSCAPKPSSDAGASKPAQPGATAAAGDAVTLTFWRPSAGEDEEKFYATVVDNFNKQNEGKIVVKMESITRGNSYAYEDKVNVAATSHSLPDILAMDGPNVSNYAHSNIVVAMDDYLAKEDLADFVPSIIQQGTYNEKLYALGVTESTVVLFYNKKLLAEAGITVPEKLEDAWTWDEYYEVAKKLTKDGVYGTNLINDKGEWITYALEQFWISNGTDIVSPDGTVAEGFVNSPQGIEAAQFIQKMASEKLYNTDPTPYEFEEGKAATRLTGPWIVPNTKNYPDLDWGMTYFPYQQKQTAPSGSWAFGVSADCKYPAEAAKFISFMTSSENCVTLAKAIAMPPARKSSFDAMEEYNSLPYKVIADQVINISHARPSTPNYPVLTQKYTEALLDIMLGSDVKEKLDKVAKDVDAEYARTYK